MRGNAAVAVGALLYAMALGGAARAEDAPVVEKFETGEINWSAKIVLASGSGAPDSKLPNVAAVRLNAERAAKQDAVRKLLETLKNLRVAGGATAAAILGDSQMRTQVERLVQACKVVDTRYFADGGVDVVVRCSLDGGISVVLAPATGERKTPTAEGPPKFSGLIVDARGSMVPPSLAPRLLDGSGAVLYAGEFVTPSALRSVGVSGYARSVESAQRDPRLGKSPMVIKATAGAVQGELVVLGEDVARLKSTNLSFLAEGRVIIVTDGP